MVKLSYEKQASLSRSPHQLRSVKTKAYCPISGQLADKRIDTSYPLLSWLTSAHLILDSIKKLVRRTLGRKVYLIESTLLHNSKIDFSFFYPRPSLQQLENIYQPVSYDIESSYQRFRDRKKTMYSESLSFWAKDIINFGKKYHQSSPNDIILDFGCGAGWLTRALCNDNHLVHALDVDLEAVNFCKNELGCQGSVIDFSNFCFRDFDFLYSVDVFEHLLDPLSTMQKIFLSLSNGGGVVISVPNFNSKLFRLDIRSHQYFAYPAHLNYFTEISLRALMEVAGFTRIKIETATPAWEKIYTLVPYVKKGLITSAACDFYDDWDNQGMGEHLLAYGFKEPV